jgi:pyrroloquinoline quinone biosynthesis protein E
MNGWGTIHLTIAPDGAALPCQEVRVIKGLEFPTVREKPLAWIWNDSPLFRKFRGEEWMKEPCRTCSEKEKDFGGCRCQAFLLTGDAANCDPACAKSPHHTVIEQAIQTVYAQDRLHRPLVRRQRDALSLALQED